MRFIHALLAALAMTAVVLPAMAAAQLDPSFDENGRQTTDPDAEPVTKDVLRAVAADSQGRLVAAGARGENEFGTTTQDFAVVRYLPDGALDPAFGDGGITIADFGDVDRASDATVADDGSTVVVGRVRLREPDRTAAGVLRLGPDGKPDPAFSEDGRATSEAVTADSAALAADGGILIGGDGVDDWSPTVLKLRPDGSPDSAFGKDGVATVFPPRGRYTASPMHIAVQPDGKIVVAGTLGTGFPRGPEHWDMFAVRFHADGRFDERFGDDGWAIASFHPHYDLLTAVAVAGRRIVLAGYAPAQRSGNDFTVARLGPDGALDRTFDGDGLRRVNFRQYRIGQRAAGSDDRALELAGAPGGGLVVSGTSGASFAAVRLGPRGAIESDKVTLAADPAGGEERMPPLGSGLVLQGDGRVVLAGSTASEDGDPGLQFGLLRLLDLGVADVTPPTTRMSRPRRRGRTVALDIAGRDDRGEVRLECRLDRWAWFDCGGTERLSDLTPGPHTFAVRARDAFGNRDASPAIRRFRVGRR